MENVVIGYLRIQLELRELALSFGTNQFLSLKTRFRDSTFEASEFAMVHTVATIRVVSNARDDASPYRLLPTVSNQARHLPGHAISKAWNMRGLAH
jgi:hypothetical protein